MFYCKIKKEYDQKRRSDGSILIKGELYTRAEAKVYSIPRNCYDIVEVKKADTYWCFGARFKMGEFAWK